MQMRQTGTYVNTTVAGEEVPAFVPRPLPPADPPVRISGELAERLREAGSVLERLDLAGEMIPSLEWFIYAFVRKEAVTSSEIEGTQTNLVDVLTYEGTEQTGTSSFEDIEEVSNYVAAVNYAREQINTAGGLPISLRLLNECHKILMRGVRGAHKQPGEVRRSQNWLGGTRPGNATFVPPPPNAVRDLLTNLEKYIHGGNDLPSLARTGLVHVQFETIHPYLDGNGRLGRMLIALLLEHWQLLRQPLLYLSVFFNQHRDEYYERLDAVRTNGDWEGWLAFFLRGVTTVGNDAPEKARDIHRLISEDRRKLLGSSTTTVSAIRLFELLPEHPVISMPAATRLLNTTKPTANKAIDILAKAGILQQTAARKRDRVFKYSGYLSTLE